MTRRQVQIAAVLVALAAGAGVYVAARSASAQGYGDALVNAMEKARRLKCQNNLKQIYAAIQQYRGKEGGRPPSLQALVDKKLIAPALLKCPSAGSAGGAVGYRYSSSAEGNQPLCCCRQPWHQDGRNVLKADGTVEWVK